MDKAPILRESLQFEDESYSERGKAGNHPHEHRGYQTFHQADRSFFHMGIRRQISRWLLVCLVAVGADAAAQTDAGVPTADDIIARMSQARAENRANFRSYTVTRDYELFGKNRNNSKSQVIAEITFVPPTFKKYAIQRTQGAGLGEKIVRRMLEGEVEITKKYSSTDISPDNYDFRFLRSESLAGQLCYVLELLPRRKDQNLLRGNIWVDANTYLLRRSEGEPGNKSPSWWLRNVQIKLVYGDVDGMWLQTASESTVNVRIFGQHTMVTHDLAYKIGDLSAAGSVAQTNLSSSIVLPDLSAWRELRRGMGIPNCYGESPWMYHESGTSFRVGPALYGWIRRFLVEPGLPGI
jgi:hypothetical protein